MGIDVQTFSHEFPTKVDKRLDQRNALVAIEEHAKSWSTQQGLDAFYQNHFVSNSELEIYLHPLADPVNFQASSKGIGIGFRTSNGGPGFHSAAIDLLDHIANQTQMTWHWGDLASGCTDETEYALTRDFDNLQEQFAGFLRLLMDLPNEQDGSNISVCLPFGVRGNTRGISCPLGIYPTTWPSEVANATDDERLQMARRFYPWWERQLGPLFWEGMLRGLLWQLAVWRPPVDDQEARALDMIDEAAHKLKKLCADLPPDLTEAMDQLEKATSLNVRPPKDGIGYRRRDITFMPFTNWRITLPGSFYEHPQDEDGSILYSDEDINVFISGYFIQNPENESFVWPESFEGVQEVEQRGVARRIGQPELCNQDGSVTQSALLVRNCEGSRRLLHVTLAVSEEEDLRIFPMWLDTIRFSDEQTAITSHGYDS